MCMVVAFLQFSGTSPSHCGISKRIETGLIGTLAVGTMGCYLRALWNFICQICFSGCFSFTLVPPLFYETYLCPCDYHCISHFSIILQIRYTNLFVLSCDWIVSRQISIYLLWLHFVVLDWVCDNSFIKHYFGCRSQMLLLPSYLSNKMSSPSNSVGWSS